MIEGDDLSELTELLEAHVEAAKSGDVDAPLDRFVAGRDGGGCGGGRGSNS